MKKNKKDWNGNSTSVFSTGGFSSHSQTPRQIHDFYATHPRAIDGLLSVYQLPPLILEPCCGNGSLSRRLEEFGYTVISEDLFEYGFGTSGIDFLQRNTMPVGCSCIVTNPPYNQALDFVLHALDILPMGGLLCMFLKTTFLEGQRRYHSLFSMYQPEAILQFVSRIPCAKNGDFSAMKSSAVSYAWFVWRKGSYGQSLVRWIE